MQLEFEILILFLLLIKWVELDGKLISRGYFYN